MVRHSARKFKMSTVALKTVLHQNTALREQVQRGIDRSSRDTIAPSIHVQIQLVRIEMTVEFADSVEHIVALLGVSVLLSLEIFSELKLELFDIEFSRHLHKYICA